MRRGHLSPAERSLTVVQPQFNRRPGLRLNRRLNNRMKDEIRAFRPFCLQDRRFLTIVEWVYHKSGLRAHPFGGL